MRIGVVYFLKDNNKKPVKVVSSLAEGLRAQGHQVDIINGKQDVNARLTVYNYIAVGAESINFFGGKINSSVSSFLANSGLIRGKRAYAFTLGNTLRLQKTLRKLMDVMEHEGIYLKKSDIIKNSEDALNIGKKLHIS